MDWARNRGRGQSSAGNRCRGDGGAALLETALVAGPFFLVVFGIFEFGLLMKDYQSVAYTTAAGAREASIQAGDLSADFEILHALNQAAVAMPRANINEIIIWHPTDEDAEGGSLPPAGCLNGTGDYGGPDPVDERACNVYQPYDFGWSEDEFDCDPNTVGPPDYFWCPEDRKDTLSDSDGAGPLEYGTDYIGIYISYEFSFATGMFGEGFTIKNADILRIEAQAVNDG